MYKKRFVIFSFLVLAAVILAVVAMSFKPEVKSTETKAIQAEVTDLQGDSWDTAYTEAQEPDTQTAPINETTQEESRPEVIKTEEIKVQSNSPEYDLKVFLHEDSLNRVVH